VALVNRTLRAWCDVRKGEEMEGCRETRGPCVRAGISTIKNDGHDFGVMEREMLAEQRPKLLVAFDIGEVVTFHFVRLTISSLAASVASGLERGV
jgi:hypothetical protein